MFELFSMGLREYWSEESEISTSDVDRSIEELQNVLSDHYQKKVCWEEPPVDKSRADEEIPVDVIDDCQLSALHAVAAKIELDGNIDGLEFDPSEPWECEVFERLAEIDDEASEDGIQKFCHMLSIGNSSECFCLPVDLPFVAQVNVDGDEDDECDDHECECGCHDGECDCEDGCCCEMDDGSVDISSLQGLRRELDVIADAMKLDTTLDIDDDDAMDFDADDMLRDAKIAWYLLSKRINEALADKLPLIIRYADDEEYDDMDIDVE